MFLSRNTLTGTAYTHHAFKRRKKNITSCIKDRTSPMMFFALVLHSHFVIEKRKTMEQYENMIVRKMLVLKFDV